MDTGVRFVENSTRGERRHTLGRRLSCVLLAALLATSVVGSAASIAGSAEPIAGRAGAPPHRAEQAGRGASSRPNLILITVDSLRADHLGAYGNRLPISPEIDRFARSATVISDAIAQAPYTKASIASLLTGLYPTTHQTYSTGAPFAAIHATGAVDELDVENTDVLGANLDSLPRTLQAQGYATAALSSNPYLIREYGFANGFDEFRYIKGRTTMFARADEMFDAAKEAIEKLPSPCFVWIHLMDVHQPYEPPEPYRSAFASHGPAHPIPPDQIPDSMWIGHSTDANLYHARYEGAIRSADASIGRFLAWLQGTRRWPQTGVVLTADHGEGFLEHGLVGHNNSLYDELLHVPLIMKLPNVRPGRVDVQMQVADLYPTLCAAAGIRPPAGLHGRNMMPLLTANDEGRDPYAYSELVNRRYALRSTEWKFIASFQGGRQLFHLTTDPGERKNVAADYPDVAERMEHALAAALATAIRDSTHVARTLTPVSPVVLERLRALGYVAR